MKKIFTKFSLLFAGLTLCANAWGTEVLIPDDPSAGIYYELSNSAPWTATVADQGWMGKYLAGDYTIPEEVEHNERTYSVTKIAANAFGGGLSSFYGTVNVILPSTITEIGASAFVINSGTIEFILNATTPPTLGEDAFPSGAVLKVPMASLTAYQTAYAGKGYTINAYEINECGGGLTWYMGDYLGYQLLTIAYDGVGTGVMTDFSYISPWYTQASEIQLIGITNGVTHIGDYAFAYCSNAISVSIPNSVTSIGTAAFAACSSLSSLSIPTSVTSIGVYAFYDVSNVTMAAGDVTIVDGAGAAGMINLLENEERNITINRPVQKGNQYNTICLPFGMDAEQIENSSLNGAEIYEFTNANIDGEYLDIHLRPVTTISAGRPYFFRFAESGDNLSSLTFEDVTITTTAVQDVTHNGVTLHGTLSEITGVSGADKLYLAANNELHYSASARTINPFRAYFEVAGVGASAPRPRIVAHKDQTTGVEEVQRDKVQGTKVIENGVLYLMYKGTKYDVQGRRIRD